MNFVKHRTFDKNELAKLIENWVVPNVRCSSEYSQIADYLDNFKEVAEAIEDGVDWVFEDYLQKNGIKI
jgi:hypothetical protein